MNPSFRQGCASLHSGLSYVLVQNNILEAPPHQDGQRVEWRDLPTEIVKPIVIHALDLDTDSRWDYCLYEDFTIPEYNLRRVEDDSPRSAAFELNHTTYDIATKEYMKTFSGKLTILARSPLKSYLVIYKRVFSFINRVKLLNVPQARPMLDLAWDINDFQVLRLIDFSTLFAQHRRHSYPMKDHFTFTEVITGVRDQELAAFLGKDISTAAELGGWQHLRSEKQVRVKAAIAIDLLREWERIAEFKDVQGDLLKIHLHLEPSGQARILRKAWSRSCNWEKMRKQQDWVVALHASNAMGHQAPRQLPPHDVNAHIILEDEPFWETVRHEAYNFHSGDMNSW